MPKSEMKFVDFIGKPLPIWEYDGLYYVTFDLDTAEKCNAGKFYFEGKKPDDKWVSGGTPEIAVAAGVYMEAAKMFTVTNDAMGQNMQMVSEAMSGRGYKQQPDLRPKQKPN